MDRINLPLPAELIARVDEIRGDVPRTVWIRRAMELRLMARNLNPDEIDRLLDDWRAASQMREMEGRFDDVDRGIALKAPARTRDAR